MRPPRKTKKDRIKSCRGKKRHPDRESAIIAIKVVQKTRGLVGMMSPYKCRYCDSWHMGRSRGGKVNWDVYEKLKRKKYQ